MIRPVDVPGGVVWRTSIRSLLIVALLALPGSAFAASWSWLVESNADATSDEVWEVEFADLDDFLAGNGAGTGYTNMNVGAVWGLKAFMASGTQYHIVLESDADAPPGSEVYVLTYDSMADVMSNNWSSAAMSAMGLSADWSIGGFAADGTQYHMLVETNADAPPGSEVAVWTYDSIADVIANTAVAGSYVTWGLTAEWSVGALVADGDQYNVLLETDAGAATGDEFYVYRYGCTTFL